MRIKLLGRTETRSHHYYCRVPVCSIMEISTVLRNTMPFILRPYSLKFTFHSSLSQAKFMVHFSFYSNRNSDFYYKLVLRMQCKTPIIIAFNHSWTEDQRVKLSHYLSTAGCTCMSVKALYCNFERVSILLPLFNFKG